MTITTVSPRSRCRRAQQVAETVGALGVQPGGGLVEQQQRRVHDERARQRHALDHAARQVGRHLVGVLRASSPTICSLTSAASRISVVRQQLEFAQRKGDVLQHAEGREQRAVLEQHADRWPRRARSAAPGGWPSTAHLALGRAAPAPGSGAAAPSCRCPSRPPATAPRRAGCCRSRSRCTTCSPSGVSNTVHSLRISTTVPVVGGCHGVIHRNAHVRGTAPRTARRPGSPR